MKKTIKKSTQGRKASEIDKLECYDDGELAWHRFLASLVADVERGDAVRDATAWFLSPKETPGMKKTARKTTKKPEAAEDHPSFAPVVAAFVNDRHVARKRMFSSDNVLTVKGKIFAMLVKGKFVAKLPKGRVDELVSRGIGEHFDPGHGRLMKEWVAVGTGRAPWVELAKEAYLFVKRGAHG